MKKCAARTTPDSAPLLRCVPAPSSVPAAVRASVSEPESGQVAGSAERAVQAALLAAAPRAAKVSVEAAAVAGTSRLELSAVPVGVAEVVWKVHRNPPRLQMWWRPYVQLLSFANACTMQSVLWLHPPCGHAGAGGKQPRPRCTGIITCGRFPNDKGRGSGMCFLNLTAQEEAALTGFVMQVHSWGTPC